MSPIPSPPTPLHTELIQAQDGSARDLMIVLHGLGDSLEGYRWLPTALNLPQLSYLLVNAPDPYFNGFSWYDFAGNPDPGIRRSRALLHQLLDHTASQAWDPARTFVFGFSQGCLLTLELMARHTQPLAGFIGISGYAHEPETLIRELTPAARSQSMLFTHGTLDPIVPCARVREQVQQLRAAGLNIEWIEFNKPHTIAGDAEMDVIRSFIRKRLNS